MIENLNLQLQSVREIGLLIFKDFLSHHSSRKAFLNTIAYFDSGYSYSGSELKHSSIGMITIKAFGRDGSFQSDGIKELLPFDNRSFATKRIVEGDIVVAHTDLTKNCDIIGSSQIVQDNYGFDEMTFSMDLVRVRSKNKAFSQALIYEYLLNDFKEWALQHCSGTTVVHLQKSALNTFAIDLLNTEDAYFLSKKLDALNSKETNLIRKIQI